MLDGDDEELAPHAAYAHRFDAGYDLATISNEDGKDGAMHARFGLAGSDLVESELQARATLFGHYGQRFVVSRDGSTDGHAVMIGIGPALRFQRSKWLGREDQLSTVHLPGPHAELWLKDGAFGARLGAEGFVDFASLESLAYPSFVERYGNVAYGPVVLGGSIEATIASRSASRAISTAPRPSSRSRRRARSTSAHRSRRSGARRSRASAPRRG